MGAGAVKLVDPSSPPSTPLRSSPGPHAAKHTDDMSCEACSIHFTFIRRKKPCHDCGRSHCSDCLTKDTVGKVTKRRCKKCRMLTAGTFTRGDLMKLTIKDLCNFMTRRHIPMNNCTEKVDLVELLMSTSNNSHYQREQADQRQRLALLEERKRQHEAEFVRSRDPQPSQNATETSHNASHTSQSAPQTAHNTSQSSQPRSAHNVQPPSQSLPPEDPEGPQQTVISDISDHTQTAQDADRQTEEAMETDAVDESTDSSQAASTDTSQEAARQQVPKKKVAHLDDVPDMDSIEGLTIRQLKEILATNYVDYKGCCEKPELIDRVRRLWADKSTEKDRLRSTSESDVCKICMDAVIDCVLLDCGHMVACTQCGKQMSECPVCRQYVVRVVHVFKA